MTFIDPIWLWALALVPLAVVWYVLMRRRRAARVSNLAAQGLRSTGAARRWGMRRHVPFAFFLLALALMITAIARPQATIVTPARQATVILAFDVSNSMGATDVKPTRLAAAQKVGKEFVSEQPASVKIGVVAFGTASVVVQPPTKSRADVEFAINHLTLGGGTSTAAGVLTALDAIAGKTLTVNLRGISNDLVPVHIGYYGGSTIVLMSDGEDTTNVGPEGIAKLASVAGVRIETIGFGTPNGTTVKIDGFTVSTSLHAATLQQIAKVSNGQYFQADSPSTVATISKGINLHFGVVKTHTEISALFAAGGLVVMLVGAALALVWFRRVL